MKILMVASEANPFAKTGGLADVVGALSETLRTQGHEVAILMPRYAHMNVQGLPRVYDDLCVWFGLACHVSRIHQATVRDVTYYLLDAPQFFERDGLYGDAAGDYPDNWLRFAVFSCAALNVVRYLFRPQIIHCHDWQAALVPVYTKTRFGTDPSFIGPRVVLTIHNLGYQGIFPREVLPRIGLDSALDHPDRLQIGGGISFLKGGIVYSDAITTVSRGYAREIQTPELGFGLDVVLRKRSDVLFGIQNGADYSHWDPRTDTCIPAHYSPEDLNGKRECKAALLSAYGLPETNLDRPLIGIVSRFAKQKGFDLIEDAAAELAAEDLALVALGTGDPHYEQFFLDLAAAYPDRFGVRIAYDDALAHLIEAGADMFLMPSMYEPSGLNQIYSLRYGTVPIVRATGGLDDTIEAGVTGFKFHEYSARAMMAAVCEALATYRHRDRWIRMMLEGMRRDFSWNHSAREYVGVYERFVGRAAAGSAYL